MWVNESLLEIIDQAINETYSVLTGRSMAGNGTPRPAAALVQGIRRTGRNGGRSTSLCLTNRCYAHQALASEEIALDDGATRHGPKWQGASVLLVDNEPAMQQGGLRQSD